MQQQFGMQVACPSCKTVIQIPGGGMYQCPACRSQFNVPQQQTMGQPQQPQYQTMAPAPQAPPQAPTAPNPEMIFAQIDTDRSGTITAIELGRALSMGGMKPFQDRTVRMMISLFDKDRSGGITRDEFQALWQFLNDYQTVFNNFDADRSGSIETGELQVALTQFGFQLSPEFIGKMLKKHDKDKTGALGFDQFIQLCLELQSATKKFQALDTDRDGKITLDLQAFLDVYMGK